jgi:hypothetical protein
VDLDWSDPKHWDDETAEPCRLCHTLTHYRDAQDRPIHKSCAADLAAEQMGLSRGAGRLTDERFPRPAATPAPEQTEVTR